MEKPRIALVVHGGAGPDEPFIHANEAEYLAGLRAATNAGYAILEAGGSALDAAQAAVRTLEDHPLFNAGRGAALTHTRTVEMCASLMEGTTRQCGAVAVVKNVRNPIELARAVMDHTDVIYLGGEAAAAFARERGLPMEPDAYFITDHQREDLKAEQDKKARTGKGKRAGTVGAVACDARGHLAAATSTGGIPDALPGRIADSSMIGVGAYAHDPTCAVSSTGDGEYSIRAVLAYDVACAVEYARLDVRAACERVIHERNAGIDGDLGVIAVDATGAVGWAFNSERMHRSWRTTDDDDAQALIWR